MVAFAAKVEIAFDSGFSTPDADRSWTDVSDRAYGQIGITWGRADQFGTCEPLTCSLSLANEDGALTPGKSSSPYYPNVKLDRPIRVTITPDGGADSVRFTGYIDGWPTTWPFGTDLGSVYSQITATSRSGRLALRNAFYSDLTEFALAGGSTAIFPLDDPEGSRRADAVEGNKVLKVAGSGYKAKFSGTAVQLRGGKYLTSNVSLGSTFSVALSFLSHSRGGCDLLPANIFSQTELLAANDGTWHRLILTADAGDWKVYLDGRGVTVSVTSVDAKLTVGRPTSRRTPSAWVSDVHYYPSELTLADAAADFAAFNGGYGDITDDRLVRYAGYAGIIPAEVDADPGAVAMGATDIAGMAALDAFRVVESTEGGVLTDARDGSLRLIGRGARYYSTPSVVLSMADEEIGSDYSPTLDRFGLRNDVTGTNSASSAGGITEGDAYSRTVKDADSIDAYGTSASSVEVNAADRTEAFAAASWMVANFAEPSPRVPNLSVDLLPLDLSKSEDAMTVFVGDRIQVTGRPSQDSSGSEEFFVEGGTETWGADTAQLVWSVSPIALNDSVLIFDEPGHAWDAGYHFAR